MANVSLVRLAAMTSAAEAQQKAANLNQQNNPYSGMIQDNQWKVIRATIDEINSAQDQATVQSKTAELEGILSGFGMNMGQVSDQINNTNIQNPTDVTAAAGHAKQHGTKFDKEVIADLSAEFGIDVKKAGTTKDWLALAKKDENVRVLDKSGKDVTAEREGRIKHGDILEVNSKTKGKVQISVGGDGEINGGDDKVISMGNQALGNNATNGINQLNTPNAQNQQHQQTNNVANNIFGNTAFNPTDMLNDIYNQDNPLLQQAVDTGFGELNGKDYANKVASNKEDAIEYAQKTKKEEKQAELQSLSSEIWSTKSDTKLDQATQKELLAALMNRFEQLSYGLGVSSIPAA